MDSRDDRFALVSRDPRWSPHPVSISLSLIRTRLVGHRVVVRGAHPEVRPGEVHLGAGCPNLAVGDPHDALRGRGTGVVREGVAEAAVAGRDPCADGPEVVPARSTRSAVTSAGSRRGARRGVGRSVLPGPRWSWWNRQRSGEGRRRPGGTRRARSSARRIQSSLQVTGLILGTANLACVCGGWPGPGCILDTRKRPFYAGGVTAPVRRGYGVRPMQVQSDVRTN